MTRLLNKINEQYFVKEVKIVEDPKHLKPLLNDISWQILESLLKKDQYPSQLAKTLNIHEQKIYYHIRQLERAQIISVSKKEEKHGSLAKYYRVNHSAFAIEIQKGGGRALLSSINDKNPKLENFLYPFIQKNKITAQIVVGSPDPHGPHQVRGRDGHMGIEVAAFFGQNGQLNKHQITALDVEIKSENRLQGNLILIGGPLTNTTTSEFNDHSLIRFQTEYFPYHQIYSEKSKKTYADDEIGLISKYPNPNNPECAIMLIAGVRFPGTMAAILGLTRFTSTILKNYTDEENWAILLRGKDLNGDGKIDAVEVVE